MAGLKKDWIPAYPLHKKLLHFACPRQLLSCHNYWFSYQMACSDHFPLEWGQKVTCPTRKSTWPGRPDGTFFFEFCSESKEYQIIDVNISLTSSALSPPASFALMWSGDFSSPKEQNKPLLLNNWSIHYISSWPEGLSLVTVLHKCWEVILYFQVSQKVRPLMEKIWPARLDGSPSQPIKL